MLSAQRRRSLIAVHAAWLSVFDFPTIAEWQQHVLRAHQQLVGFESGMLFHATLDSPSGSLQSVGFDDSFLTDYARNWQALDLQDETQTNEILNRRLVSYTTELLWYGEGRSEEMLAEFSLSPLWNDFYVAKGIGDVVGMADVSRRAGTLATIHMYADDRAHPMVHAEGLVAFGLLEAAFLAATHLLQIRQRLGGAYAAMIDQCPQPMVLLDGDGRCQHANPAWRGAMMDAAERRAIEQAAAHLARRRIAALRRPTDDDVSRVGGHVMAVGAWRLTAAPIAMSGVPDVMTIVTAELMRTARPNWLSRAVVAGLPPRLAQVAALIAVGRSSAEIARELGVRTSTARRHTERVMGRLGLHRRGEVAEELERRAMAADTGRVETV